MVYLYRLLGLMALLLALIGCQQAPETAKGEASEGKPLKVKPAERQRIALIMKNGRNPFFIQMEQGAVKAAWELKLELVALATSQESAIEQQIQLVQAQLKAGIDAIVIAPADSRRLVPALKKAQAQGVVIINVDNPLDAAAMHERQMQPVPFVSIDNEQAAYQSARFLANQIKGPAEVAIIEGISAAHNARQRAAGAARAFAEHGQLKLVAQESANWSHDEAYVVAERIFASHPKVEGVFCANDQMAFGVIRYLRQSGLNKVKVASFDGVEEARIAIAEGQLLASIDQQADMQGYHGVRLASQLLSGQQVPLNTWLEARLLTRTKQ